MNQEEKKELNRLRSELRKLTSIPYKIVSKSSEWSKYFLTIISVLTTLSLIFGKFNLTFDNQKQKNYIIYTIPENVKSLQNKKMILSNDFKTELRSIIREETKEIRWEIISVKNQIQQNRIWNNKRIEAIQSDLKNKSY